jgi:ankyrin repeat protein
MKTLPASPDLSHPKKQAKHLLRDLRAGEAQALKRFAQTLPAARNIGIATPAARAFKLHDAQSVIAREHGFASWTELKRYVEWKRSDRAARLTGWLTWAFEGNARELGLAVRMLGEEADLFAGDPWFACVTGDEARLRDHVARTPDFVARTGGPLSMLPLVAVTHSRLILKPGFEAPLLACARLLLAHGADVNASWTDTRWPDSPLPVLYGAAGRTHHDGMTGLLLQAGANPDDNESLYHSVESRDPACTKLLLDAGARVLGTNAIGRALDYDKLELLNLLLRHGGDAREQPWIHHAILRGRSLDHVRALIEAGADLRATNGEGVSLYRWAQMHGRVDVVRLLHEYGVDEPLSEEEEFVAACTRGDEAAARAILQRTADIFPRLTNLQLQAMPQLAAVGEIGAVRTMLSLGWPREIKTQWDATALNLAVFQGDAAMAALLLDAGADWRTPHGFGDHVLGTLSFASQADGVADPAPRDYVGCARALIDHGVPYSAFQQYEFSGPVAEYLETRSVGAG